MQVCTGGQAVPGHLSSVTQKCDVCDLFVHAVQVLPDAFIVTAPHKRSSSWRPTPGTAADAAHLQRIRRVYESFKQQLAQQGLAPKELAG